MKKSFCLLLAVCMLLILPVSVCADGVLYGDVNGDGNVNAKDATLILRYSVGKLTEDQKFDEVAANVNADAKINAKDATLILRYSVKKLDKFPADTHEHSYEAVVTDPTCTEDGYTTYTCSCGDSYMGNETDALGHDWNYGDCKRCGAGPGDVPFCDECSFTATEVIAPACTEKGYTTYICKVCGNYYTEDIKATGHCWGDWVEIKEPTTSAEGEETRTCSTCGATETRAAEKLPEENDDFCEFSHDGKHVFSYWHAIYDENGNRVAEERFCLGASKDGVKCDGYEYREYTIPENVAAYLSDSHYSDEAITYINEYRAAHGLPALRVDHSDFVLLRAAELRVSFSHTRPNGGYIYEDGWASECIAGGTNAKSVIDGWYNSTGGHKETMLNASYTVACVAYNGTCWVLLVA